MAERRKIVIETGARDEPLPTPHFDAEATMTARPVVPLTDEAHPLHYGPATAKPFWKRPALLVLVVLAAVGVGVAAGFAIGMYRNRQASQPAVVNTEQAPEAEKADAGRTIEPQPIEPPAPTPSPAEQARAVVPEVRDEPEVEPEVEERERTTHPPSTATARRERKADDDDDEAKAPVEAKPPVARGKKPIKVDEYTIGDEREARRADEQAERREERRAERRERRRRQREDDAYIPRNMERAGREVNRIREIFEGKQP